MLPLHRIADVLEFPAQFQWAPTLGGECYYEPEAVRRAASGFQWAPTLGGECYYSAVPAREIIYGLRFNGHPPLGVNATV